MKLLRLLWVFVFAFQAMGLAELAHAGEDTCAVTTGQACDGQDREQHEEDGAACHFHCTACNHASVLSGAAGPARPATLLSVSLEGPFLFVPLAPCASIFHPPA